MLILKLLFPYLVQYLQNNFQNWRKSDKIGSIKYKKAIVE